MAVACGEGLTSKSSTGECMATDVEKAGEAKKIKQNIIAIEEEIARTGTSLIQKKNIRQNGKCTN
ncbi:MAG: hypothetical protein A2219_01030 [Elusimicrobia bacterium RIFOXYA2_FULL_50_26]|nr:MAG: hypothetical protein A2219_01030 [Elusimicrobia bacterium RIFOXYA2_FULL_50_26]OGS22713.1 MAG: hypothetical protein A2314_08610 [Elusimicrobia bacterium RIFOXYB2_FULL_50_12]